MNVSRLGQPTLEITDGGRTGRIELRSDGAEVRVGQDAPLCFGREL